MEYQRYKDTRTGEIVTQVSISEIEHFEAFHGRSETRNKCAECGAKNIQRQFYIWRDENDSNDGTAFDIGGAEPCDMGSDFWCPDCEEHPSVDEYEQAIDEQFTCTACGRPELNCSRDPCAAVIKDRGEEIDGSMAKEDRRNGR